MQANKIQVTLRSDVKKFIGDPGKMAGSHFSESVGYFRVILRRYGMILTVVARTENIIWMDDICSDLKSMDEAKRAVVAFIKEMVVITYPTYSLFLLRASSMPFAKFYIFNKVGTDISFLRVIKEEGYVKKLERIYYNFLQKTLSEHGFDMPHMEEVSP